MRKGSGQTFLGTIRATIPVDVRSEYLSWSPDGKFLLGRGDGLLVWNLETGEVAHQFSNASIAKFHPNGEHIVAADAQGIVVWDFNSARLVKRIPISTYSSFDYGTSMHFSANGKKVLVLGSYLGGEICDLDAGTWKKIDNAILGVDEEVLGVDWAADISPDGETLAISGQAGKLLLVDAATFEIKETRDIHSDEVDVIAYSPDGKLLASCSEESSKVTVRIWDAASGDRLSEYFYDDYLAKILEFSAGGSRLVFAGTELRVNDPFGDGLGEELLDRGGWSISAAAISPDGRMVAATTNKDDCIYIFDLEKTQQHKTIQFAEDWHPERFIPLAGGGTALMLEGWNAPSIVDVKAQKKIQVFGPEKYKGAMGVQNALSPDWGTLIMIDSTDLDWWNLKDGSLIRTTEGYYENVSFTPDGKFALACGHDFSENAAHKNIVQEIDAHSGELKRQFGGHAVGVISAAVSPDNNWLASGGKDANILLFDYQTGELKQRKLLHQGPVTRVQFSPDSQWLVSIGGEQDDEVGLWKMGEAEPRLLKGHQAIVKGAAFSPDSRTLVTADAAGMLRIWKLAGDLESFALAAHNEPITWLEPLPEGDGFLTLASHDSPANIWKFAELSQPELPGESLLRTPAYDEDDRRFLAYPGQVVRFLRGSGRIEQMAVSADESLAATVTYSGEVVVWDLAGMRRYALAQTPEGTEHIRKALGVAFPNSLMTNDYQEPEGKYLVTHFKVAEDGECEGLAFSQDGKTLFAASANEDGGQIAFYDAKTGKLLKSFAGPQEYLDVAVSPTSDLVAVSSSKEELVRLLDLSKLEEIGSVRASAPVKAAGMNSDGKYLLVATDESLELFDLDSRMRLSEQEHRFEVESIDPSLDEKTIAVLRLSSEETELKLFALPSLEPISQGAHISAGAKGADFTPDGKHIIFRGAYPMFCQVETGELDFSIPYEISDLHITKDQALLIASEGDSDGLQVYSWPDMINRDLQTTLEKHKSKIAFWRREGRFLVMEISVDGRESRKLLGDLKELSGPMKLDLRRSLNLTDEDLANLEGNEHIYGIALADFYPEQISVAGIKSLVTLSNLEELVIPHPTDEILKELENFPNLRILRLGETEASSESFRVLAGLKRLRILELTLDEAQGEEALKVFPELPELSSLSLNWDDATSAGIASLGKLKTLETLELIDCEELDAKSGLAELKNIKQLAISSRSFTDAGFVHLKDLQNLEELSFYGSQLREGEILFQLKNLKWVRFSYESESLVEEFHKQRPSVRAFIN